MPDDEREQKSRTDKLSEATRQVTQELNIQEVDTSRIEQLRAVPEVEQQQEPFTDKQYEGAAQAAYSAGLQEVDLYKSDQFRPADSPPSAKDEIINQPEPDFALSQDTDLLEQSSVRAHSTEMNLILAFEKEGEKQIDSGLESAVQVHRNQAELEQEDRVKEQEQQRTKRDDYER